MYVYSVRVLPFSSSCRRLRHQEPVESDAGALRRAAGPGGGGPAGQSHQQSHAYDSRGRQRNGDQVRSFCHSHRQSDSCVHIRGPFTDLCSSWRLELPMITALLTLTNSLLQWWCHGDQRRSGHHQNTQTYVTHTHTLTFWGSQRPPCCCWVGPHAERDYRCFSDFMSTGLFLWALWCRPV